MKKIELIDLTLRDGQQSLVATRMTTEQALSAFPDLLDAGFKELELWGGATIDAPLRFLNENPWGRLDEFYKLAKGRANIRALIRGQNLFAYSPYPDNLVIAFCKAAIRSGVSTMRAFDALNDKRNVMISLIASKAFGGKAECCISYTTSPIHTTEKFVQLAADYASEGADIIAIKDMAGLLNPRDAAIIIPAIKKEISVPLTVHSHSTVGYGETTALVGLMFGADRIDVAVGPFAGGSSHPPVELVAVMAERLGIDHGLNHEAIQRAQKKLFEVRKALAKFDSSANNLPKPIPNPLPQTDIDKIDKAIELVRKGDFDEARRTIVDLMTSYGYPKPDEAQLDAQVPGGMLSNLRNQLKEVNQLQLLPQILEEVARVRADSGYPPLVTPTSQIVGSQAAFNVQTGQRYKIVSREFKDMVRGRYGRPGPISEEFLKMVTGSTERYTQRSGHYIDDVPLTSENGFNPPPFINNHRDLLLYYMLPGPTKDFFEKQDSKAKPPEQPH
ncbi:MAG: oxaloacetate decarboxylase subunit alpha [Caldisericales bacterium]|nr:oxaloacetate decarboxylase subunit alpha [bacterium]